MSDTTSVNIPVHSLNIWMFVISGPNWMFVISGLIWMFVVSGLIWIEYVRMSIFQLYLWFVIFANYSNLSWKNYHWCSLLCKSQVLR